MHLVCGGGLHLNECLLVRIKDVGFDRKLLCWLASIDVHCDRMTKVPAAPFSAKLT